MTLAYAPASTAAAVVAERVRERLRAERTDPGRDPELATRIVHAEVRRERRAVQIRHDGTRAGAGR